MTVLLPLMLWAAHAKILGGAKPIPVNPNNYRHYRRGDIIVSLAGIVTNFGIAIVCLPLIILVGLLGQATPALVKPLAILQAMLEQGIFLNLLLALFNLIPIPPLDGSHVFKYLLPGQLAVLYQRISSAGFLLVFALLYFGGSILNWWFTPIIAVAQRFQLLYGPYMLMSNPFLP
jgi:Zn-dependent protease